MSTAILRGRDELLDERTRRLEVLRGGHWLRAARFHKSDASVADESMSSDLLTQASIVIAPPAPIRPKVDRFISEQEFEGVVLSLDDAETFWARLIDHTAGLPDEEAQFSFNDVPVDDWPLITPGALFSWNIGREVREGQVRRVSEIRFRRFFRFSKAAIAQAEADADDLVSLIEQLDAEYSGEPPRER